MTLDLCFHLHQKKHQEKRKEVKKTCNTVENFELTLYYIALAYEKLYLEHLPNADMYEKSYMHRDVLNQVAVTK